ncbi:LuxR C-terminal-related transcriptional regulator [Hydrocarboniphaga effusa]|uniref:LuxR C-terminal-related transcriptional regulator n=2 Tax=Hydrocarboniphaga effusa TaxID=243629 RepID=UPI003137CB77
MNKTTRPATALSDGLFRRYSSFVTTNSQRILRESILERIFAETSPPIVILQAPAGHGKSTVLQQVRNESAGRGMRCGWLNLDESDNDASRHSSHLQRLLGQIFKSDGPLLERPAESGAAAASHKKPSDWFIDQLEADASPTALFLDEFEVLSNRAILSFWKDLLSKLPLHVRVYIATRALPDIGMPRLRVASKILLLQSTDLCFSLDEVHEFFAASGTLPMESGDIETVHRCTEGWPAAIQLFRLGLSKKQPSDALQRIDRYRPRELADYLTECVLEGLSPDTQNFLERTCILNRLGAQVCNVLTGRSDSHQQLLRLEKFGLFVSPLDDNHTWFRYHTLLATHLRELLLNLHQAKFRALHRQAAEWFYENGMYDDAMHHAVTSADHALSAQILEKWSEQLVTDGEMTIAERWFDCIPIHEVACRPILKRRMIWALIFLRQHAKVFALMGSENPSDWYPDNANLIDLPAVAVATICYGDMAKAFALVDKVSELGATPDRFTAFELAAAANLDSFRLLVIGDFRQSEVRLATAQAFNSTAKAFFTVGYTDSVRGVALLLQGRIQESLDVLRSSLTAQRRALDAPFAIAPLAACYVWALYVADDCAAAVEVLGEYREMILKSAIPDFFTVGVVSAARAYRVLGQHADANSLLCEAEALCLLSRWSRALWLIRRERLSASASPHARDALPSAVLPQAGRSENWMPFGELATESHLAPIRQLIRQKQYDEAISDIARIAEKHSESAFVNAQLGIVKAILLDARGMHKPAARQFAAALKLCHDGGYIRFLIDEGKPIRHLLEGFLSATQLTGESPIRTFASEALNRIQGFSGQMPDSVPASAIDLGAFSSREREIIDCLRQRMSNKEIAVATNITENTVKFHLKNIFGKLGVQSRTEAFSLVSHIK